MVSELISSLFLKIIISFPKLSEPIFEIILWSFLSNLKTLRCFTRIFVWFFLKLQVITRWVEEKLWLQHPFASACVYTWQFLLWKTHSFFLELPNNFTNGSQLEIGQFFYCESKHMFFSLCLNNSGWAIFFMDTSKRLFNLNFLVCMTSSTASKVCVEMSRHKIHSICHFFCNFNLPSH